MSLLPVVSLVHYSPSGMLYSTATMTIPFKLTDYQRSSSFNVSLHVLSLSRRVFIMQYLLPAVSLSYRVSPTIFSYWYPVQYCNNDILLKFTDYLTQLLPSVSHSMSCLSPAALLSCSVSAVPLSCRVSRTLLSFWYALQHCNNDISNQTQ